LLNLRLPKHRNSTKNNPGQLANSQALPIDNKQQQNNNKMGAEASAEAGAEVFAEAIGDMCLGLPPGAGMPFALMRAAAKAAATPKPIHIHVGSGAAVTAAAAAGAASRARPGVALNFGRPRAIDATSTQARSRITSLDDFVGQRCESFPNGQPGRIVETFQFTREGGIYVTTGTGSGRNTYTRHGEKLVHRQARHITATLRPNGELAWSHGYGSRIQGGGGW